MADLVFAGETPAHVLNADAMPINTDLELYKGDYVELFVVVKDDANAPINLTGYTARASLKTNYSDNAPINFTCTIPDPATGTVRIYLPSSESANLVAGPYIWDFEIINADDDFAISFHGGWTHDAGGVQGNGSNAWADTHFSPRVQLTSSNGSLGMYVRGTGTDSGQPYDFGCDDGDIHPIIVISKYSSGNYYCSYGDDSFQPTGSSVTPIGFWITNRNSASQTQAVKNGVVLQSQTLSVTLPDVARTLYLGCNNRAGSPTYWSGKQYGLAFTADGMTAPELTAFNTVVTTFETALSRQI